MTDLWQNAMDHAVALARKAGSLVRDAVQNDMKVMLKSSSVDLVTKTDQKVEQLIIDSVKEKFPTHRGCRWGGRVFLDDADIIKVFLDDADIIKVFLDDADIIKVFLDDADIIKVFLDDADIIKVFLDADIIKVFLDADIIKVFLDDADIIKVFLDDADIIKVFLDADIIKVFLDDADIIKVFLDDADIIKVFLDDADIMKVFLDADIIKVFLDADIIKVFLDDADIIKVFLDDADIIKVFLEDADIIKVFLEDADIIKVFLDDADIIKVFLDDADIIKVFLDDADIVKVFALVILINTIFLKSMAFNRYPFVAVSIGFAVNRKLEFGVVYSCIEDKMYTARKGKGAFCNGQILNVSDQKEISQSIIATEFGSNRDTEVVDKIFSSMRKILCLPIHGIRGVGTAATNMCLVASGCVEAYYEIGIHCWDIAAGAIIVTEAGGVLMDVEGGPLDLMSRRVVAANNKIIAERIVKEIDAFTPLRDDASTETED
ncbi:uncharacterized protein LOC118394366 [Oncorhynchus keta]|uniref:uncharacterized protein LOC118394366 n=1 Tax=Oncorhynchus keta TaxID=8018 RepID=UPI00227BF662|nr:uncharacterized protein LOC118394366 [Oncorhynchus keta]